MFESLIDMGAIGLLIATFLSASILPYPAEPLIVAAVSLLGPFLTFVASFIGGLLGAVSNYYIGLKGVHRLAVRWPEKEKKAQRWIQQWGSPIIIAAPWIPFIGDPMIIAVGTLQMPLKRFLTYAVIGRAIKTAALVMLGNALLALFAP
ncbi:MAG: VTT domain-containing protein [Candidatus Aenigmatarchaeota archaeon]